VDEKLSPIAARIQLSATDFVVVKPPHAVESFAAVSDCRLQVAVFLYRII